MKNTLDSRNWTTLIILISVGYYLELHNAVII